MNVLMKNEIQPVTFYQMRLLKYYLFPSSHPRNKLHNHVTPRVAHNTSCPCWGSQNTEVYKTSISVESVAIFSTGLVIRVCEKAM